MEQAVLVTDLEPMITPFLIIISLVMGFIIVMLLRMGYVVLREVYARRKQGLFNMLAVYVYTNTNPFKSLDNHIVATILATLGMWLVRIAITYAWIPLTGREQEAMFNYGTIRECICGQGTEGIIVGIILIIVLLITLIISLAKRNMIEQNQK